MHWYTSILEEKREPGFPRGLQGDPPQLFTPLLSLSFGSCHGTQLRNFCHCYGWSGLFPSRLQGCKLCHFETHCQVLQFKVVSPGWPACCQNILGNTLWYYLIYQHWNWQHIWSRSCFIILLYNSK